MYKSIFLLAYSFVSSISLIGQENEYTEAGKASLVIKAREILGTHCGECHGKGGNNRGDMYLDRNFMVRESFIDLKSPEESELYQIIKSGDMPLEARLKELPGGRFPEADLQVIKEWIEAGAPDWKRTHPEEQLPKITHSEMLTWMRDDLLDEEAIEPEERSLIRYFTLTNLFNNETVYRHEMKNYRTALVKLINSLSWGDKIVDPTPVNVKGDVNETILRVKITDLNWNESQWNELVINREDYPYPYITGYSDNEMLHEIIEETGTDVPFLRADWFIANAAKPELYHLLLNLPDTDAELEVKKLNIQNINKNIVEGRVMRSGFLTSGVSKFNRIVERHQVSQGNYYWKSYDFSSNKGAQNIFERPIGPVSVFPGEKGKTFEHAGGEMIFGLPNGLQGYFLTDEKGERINRAPIDIVRNINKGEGVEPVVSNGLSCMTCHTKGIISFDNKAGHLFDSIKNSNADYVRRIYDKDKVIGSIPFKPKKIYGIYKEASRINKKVREDRERFKEAVRKTGGVTGNEEPIALLANLYEGPLDVASAACELSVSVKSLKSSIEECRELQEIGLNSLLVEDGPGYARQAWEDKYETIYKILQEKSDRCDPERPEFPIEYFAFNLGIGSDDKSVEALAWDPETKNLKIYSSGRNSSIIEWSASGSWHPSGKDTGKPEDEPRFINISSNKNSIRKLKFSPKDKSKMAVLSKDSSTKEKPKISSVGSTYGNFMIDIFDTTKFPSADPLRQISVKDESNNKLLDIENFEWNPDGSKLAVVASKKVYLFDSINGKPVEDIRRIEIGDPYLLDWSPCGEMLVVTNKNRIEIWDSEFEGNNAQALHLLDTLPGLNIHSLDWSFKEIKVDNLGSDEDLVSAISIGHTGNQVQIIFVGTLEEENGNLSVEIDAKRDLIKNAHTVLEKESEEDVDVVVEWSPNVGYLATGSFRARKVASSSPVGGEIKIWDTRNLSGKEILKFPIPPIIFKENDLDRPLNNNVFTLSWSDNQNYISAGLRDGRVITFETSLSRFHPPKK